MDSIIFQGYMVLGVVFLSLTNLAHVTFNLFDFLKYIWQKEKAIQSLRAENVLSGYKQAAPIVFAVTSTSSAKKRLSSPFRTTRIQCVGVACCHLWYNCRALAVTAIAVHRTIATAIVRRLDYG